MITVHGMSASGNCHKLRMALDYLGEPYRWNETDTRSGATRSAAFRALNPNGKVPIVELDDGTVLAESNAILHYLADGSPLLPTARLAHAQVLQWMFFEQYSHEPNIATARWLRAFHPDPASVAAKADALMADGHQALQVMEQHLGARAFFVDERYTIADIALFAYTHAADDGGFDLGRYPAIVAWIARVLAQPGASRMPGP